MVVADTSPLNYLIPLEAGELLAALYKKVLVPPAVMQELGHSPAPAVVQRWLLAVP